MAGSLSDFVQLLHRAVQPPVSGARSPRRVNLETVDLLSLVTAASWNVSFMLLRRFLSELGFQPRHQLQRGHRILTDLPVVILVAEFKSPRTATLAYLVYAECGRFRASAAFLDDAVGFIRGSEVVTYPVIGLSDTVLLHSSAYGLSSRTSITNLPENGIPPAA